MPRNSKVGKAEAGLKASARKKGVSGKRSGHYVYGSLNNMGMMRGNKMTAKGRQKARTVLS